MTLLRVNHLSASFSTDGGSRVGVLDDVSLTVGRGETLGLVGESGCGKSMTALSIMGLLPKPSSRIDTGEVLFEERDLLQLSSAELGKVRGQKIAMIFQEPMTALNPVYKIGKQLQEPFILHRPDMGKFDRIQQARSLLAEVGIPDPERRLQEYPHQLSGGLRQRVMIAMALALNPSVLIADEPTTALDVTIQAQILELIVRLRERHGTAVIFITHDLGVIAETCDRVAVMYAGRIVEQANVEQFFNRPAHPYSRGLLKAIPRLDDPPRCVLDAIPGAVPGLDQLGSGCHFSPRCDFSSERCQEHRPALNTIDDSHSVACFHWREPD